MKTLFLVTVLCSSALATDVTPVQKVIQLMEGMLAKGKEEKHSEQVQFASFTQFCEDTSVEKKRDIQEAEDHLELLNAEIQKQTVTAAKLTKEIAELDEDISVWNGDIKAATNVRHIEKADYDETHKDYTESIDALQRAIAVLKKQAYDRKQSAAFVQVKALTSLDLIPTEAKNMIEQFIQQDPEAEGLAVSAPEASGYDFQSSGIIEMLEKLLDKFVGEKTVLEKEEMNSKHAYDMLMQDLKAQIGQAERDRDEKAEAKAAALQAKADAEADHKETTRVKEEDEKYLANLTATCEQKSSDFEARQKLRTEEIQAIEKAIEIISSGAVKGNSEKYLPGLVQTSAFAQLRSDLTAQAQHDVASFLKKQGAKLNSRILSTLAVRVANDPFVKVRKMIKDLLVRLMEEANEESEHKGWCDKELSTNEQTRKEKTDQVESLHANIDELEASLAKLNEDIEELTKAIAELNAAMAKATTDRQEEKALNTETIKNSEEAQAATAQALVVLKEFYAKAGDATALLQQPIPEIMDKPYKGMQGESGGVIGMLEVIESDFARLESETKAAEATAQKEYDSFMSESKADKESKSTEIEHKTAKKQDEEQALQINQQDLEGTQKELDAALQYFDKLKPSCVDSGVSYEDRVARRKEEIESLQEALKILNGEDIP